MHKSPNPSARHAEARAPATTSRLRRGIGVFASLTGGRLAGDLFGFVFFVVVAQHFGEVAAGLYSIAFGLGGFLFTFTDLGLYYFYIQRRDEGAAGGAELGVALLIRAILVSILMLALVAAFALVEVSDELGLLIVMVALAQFGYALRMGLSVVYLHHGEAHVAGIIEALTKLAGAVLGIAVIWLGGSLVQAVLLQPVTSLLAAAVSFRIVSKRHCRPVVSTVRARLLPVLRATMPFGLSELPRLIVARTDVLALGFLLGPAAAGAYNAAFRIIFLLQLATHYAAVSLVAEATRAAAGTQAAINELYEASLRLCALLAVPCAGGIWLVAPEVILLIYGPQFAESAHILRLLALVLLLSIVRTIQSSFLTLSGLQALRARIEWVAAVVMLVASLILIPLAGLPGSVGALGLTEACMLALFTRQMWRQGARPRLGVRVGAAFLGTASFLMLASVLPPGSLVAEVLVCALTYGLVLAIIPAIRRDEMVQLTRAVRFSGRKRATQP